MGRVQLYKPHPTGTIRKPVSIGIATGTLFRIPSSLLQHLHRRASTIYGLALSRGTRFHSHGLSPPVSPARRSLFLLPQTPGMPTTILEEDRITSTLVVCHRHRRSMLVRTWRDTPARRGRGPFRTVNSNRSHLTAPNWEITSSTMTRGLTPPSPILSREEFSVDRRRGSGGCLAGWSAKDLNTTTTQKPNCTMGRFHSMPIGCL